MEKNQKGVESVEEFLRKIGLKRPEKLPEGFRPKASEVKRPAFDTDSDLKAYYDA